MNPDPDRWRNWEPDPHNVPSKPSKGAAGVSSDSLDSSTARVERQILDTLASQPLTSAELFDQIADGQDSTPAAQRLIDGALDSLHHEGRLFLSLPEGRWHLTGRTK